MSTLVQVAAGVLGGFAMTVVPIGAARTSGPGHSDPSRYGHSDRIERHMLPAVSTGPLDPAWSPDGRWIAFASGRDGVAYAAQVYLVHPDGSGLHAITGGPWSHVQPAWSRDGRALFVYRSQETADSEFGMVARVALPPGD